MKKNNYLIFTFDYKISHWLMKNVKNNYTYPEKPLYVTEFLSTKYLDSNFSVQFVYIQDEISKKIDLESIKKVIYIGNKKYETVIFISRDGVIQWLYSDKPDINMFFQHYLCFLKVVIDLQIKVLKLETLIIGNESDNLSGLLDIKKKDYNEIFNKIYVNDNYNCNSNLFKKGIFTKNELRLINSSLFLKEANYLLTYPHYFYEERNILLKKILSKIIKNL